MAIPEQIQARQSLIPSRQLLRRGLLPCPLKTTPSGLLSMCGPTGSGRLPLKTPPSGAVVCMQLDRLCSAHVDNSQGRLLSLYCSPAVHCSVTPTRAIKFAAADSGGALGDVWPPSREYTDSTGHRLHQHLHRVPGGTPSTLTPESRHRTTTKWRAPTTSTSPKLSRVIVYKRHRCYLSGSIESTSISTPTSSSTSSTR